MGAIEAMHAAEITLARLAPSAEAIGLLRRALDCVAAMHAEAEQSERAGRMIVTLHQEEPITPKMLEVMRLIERGGFKMPNYRSRHWRGWNDACTRGFIGQGRDGFEKLNQIGRAKLAEAERQITPLRPAPLLLTAGSTNELMRLYND